MTEIHVGDIMIEEVAIVELGLSVADCVQTALREGAGSIIVMADGGSAGIVIESDTLRTGMASGKPLSTVSTCTVMSSPIKWIWPGSTTCAATKKMRGNRVKKLVVIDGSEMVGIITVTNTAFHPSDVTRGVGQVIGFRDKWESDHRFRRSPVPGLRSSVVGHPTVTAITVHPRRSIDNAVSHLVTSSV